METPAIITTYQVAQMVNQQFKNKDHGTCYPPPDAWPLSRVQLGHLGRACHFVRTGLAELRLDYATCNPVSLLMKAKG